MHQSIQDKNTDRLRLEAELAELENAYVEVFLFSNNPADLEPLKKKIVLLKQQLNIDLGKSGTGSWK